MEIIKCEQKSPEWFDLRSKRMTASHATAIGANGKASLEEKKKLPAGLRTYVTSLMQDYYSSKEKEHFTNKDTERGNLLEDSAAFTYCMETGFEVEKIGFVIHSDFVGVSPDLFTSEGGLAEIKCPDDKEYFRVLIGGAVDTGYIWQMQMQMLVCEKSFCDHVMYNPNYKQDLIIKRFYPDEKQFSALKRGFSLGQEMIEEISKEWEGILK